MRRVCVVRTVPKGARCIQNYDFTRLLQTSVKVFLFSVNFAARKANGKNPQVKAVRKSEIFYEKFSGGRYVQNSDW